jgi:hypothetical protein
MLIGVMPNAVATSKQTVEWLLTTSQRVKQSVPVHNVFLQSGRGRAVKPGPLAQFVASGRGRALDLFLLLHVRAVKEPYNVALPAPLWARALGIGSTKTASAAISKQWAWLASQRLIERKRFGRLADIVALREDGSGETYMPGNTGGPYFNVPFEYWTENWYGRLDLPTKATLLIALSLLDDFYLPQEKAPAWYGISADTLGRGLVSLKRNKLLTEIVFQKAAPGSALGYTRQHYYTLLPPFGPRGKRSGGLEEAIEVGQ